ncbi:MAG TPA: hypothetical protein PK411_15735, partial [Mesotoga infera]|nr:hypothetical protein [Mesotoga infera]
CFEDFGGAKMAIKEISVTLMNRKRRVDCLAAIGPPFFLPNSPLCTPIFSTAQSYTAVYTQHEAAKTEKRWCQDAG